MIRYAQILLLFIPILVKAQDYSGMINDKKFDKAWKKCQKVIKKNPLSVEEIYFAALIQSKIQAGNLFNPIEAQENFKKAQQLYKQIVDVRKLEKLDEIQINLKAFRTLSDSISNGGLLQAKLRNTEQAYIDYLNLFSIPSETIKQFAISERNRLAFIAAKTENSEDSYQEFINKYPIAFEVSEAKNLRNRLAFEMANTLNTIEAFDRFIQKYPESIEWNEAITKRNHLAFQQAQELNTLEAFESFIEKYPEAIQWGEAITKRNQLAFQLAQERNTLEAFESFIQKYPEAIQRSEAITKRNQLAFQQAQELNTVESFEGFIQKYPEAIEWNEAITKRNHLAFQQAQGLNTLEAFESFMKNYPEASECKIAQEKVHELAYNRVKNANNSKTVELFIQKYPKADQINEAQELFEALVYKENVDESDWLSLKSFIEVNPSNRNNQRALRKIKSLAQVSNDVKLIEYLVNTEPWNDTLIHRLYEIFSQDGELSSLLKFQNKYPQYVSNEYYRDYQLAEQSENLLLHLPFNKKNFRLYKEFISNAPSNELSFVALQRLLSPHIAVKQFSEALKLIDLIPIDINLPKVKNLKKLLMSKTDPNIQPKSIGGINTAGNEFSPVISADDKSLFFCGQNRDDNLGGEDIYETVKVTAGFEQPKLNSLSTVKENEAPVAISSDGTKMIYFKSGDLFVSEKNKSGWSEPHELNNEINQGDWQGDAMLSSDGNVLLFSSCRPNEILNLNGMDDKYYHGDLAYPTDIFICEKDKNGNWKYPLNIGSIINTPFCDRFPFLHPDMKTLYFSSDGHGGFGKLDVFKSTRLYDTCWTCWSEPINMGKEINTIESDAGYKISTSGDVAYFTQNKRNIQESSVVFVLDVSGSMGGEKIAQLREVSKKTIQEVINNNAEIAIAAFDGDCNQPISYYLPFTKNYAQVESFVDNLQAGGGTPMYEAYYQASQLLKQNNKNPLKNRVIVLMTDGDATCSTPLDLFLDKLKEQKSLFKTQTIAYDVEVNSKAYFDLNEIADFSGGAFFEASTPQDLGSAFENVNMSIFQIISGSDNKEIFEINLPVHLRPDMVAKVEGELKNSKNEPISTTIRWEDLEADKVIGIAKTDPADGSYFIALPLGKNYGYFVEDSTYFPASNNLDLRSVTTQVVVNNNIQVITFQEMIDQGIAVSMNNLFFEFGKFQVLPSSYPELKRIAKIIRKYKLKVEIDGHTDDVGDAESNLVLSNKRAEAVKEFLVRIGCKDELLITHGFGEAKPRSTNDSEAGRANNRRVELKLIK